MDNLKETKMLYKKEDFYHTTPIDDKTFLSFLNDRKLDLDDSDIYVIVQSRHQYKPYALSFDLYGKEDYWWLIVRHNMDILIDPIRDMKEGIVLRVPAAERVTRYAS